MRIRGLGWHVRFHVCSAPSFGGDRRPSLSNPARWRPMMKCNSWGESSAVMLRILRRRSLLFDRTLRLMEDAHGERPANGGPDRHTGEAAHPFRTLTSQGL
jgi:hypothetical protein